MDVTDPKVFIDHIDKNRLNNTRKNLRLSDKNKNPRNRTKQENTSSKYTGIHYDKSKKLWSANVKHNRKQIFIMRHKNEEVCARSRDLYIMENFKDEHYTLNFEWSDADLTLWKKKIDDFKSKPTRNKNKDNITIKKSNTAAASKYFGVYKRRNRWTAIITRKKKEVYIRTFDDETVCARARDLYIIQNIGNYGYSLNFQWSKEDIAKWNKKINSLE